MSYQPHRIISEWKRKAECDSHSHPTLPISTCIYYHGTFHYGFSTEWKKKQNVYTVTLPYLFQPAFTTTVLFTTDFPQNEKEKKNVIVTVTLSYPFQPAFTAMVLFKTAFPQHHLLAALFSMALVVVRINVSIISCLLRITVKSYIKMKHS